MQEARIPGSPAEAAGSPPARAGRGPPALPGRALDRCEVGGDSALAAAPHSDAGRRLSLAALALTPRPEIGRALAEYAVAEAGLRGEVARQYPDLDLGPGFIWDQGVHRWTLALALPNLLKFRNRSAIDEAEAGRAAAAARVAELQDELLADAARRAVRCRGARLERARPTRSSR